MHNSGIIAYVNLRQPIRPSRQWASLVFSSSVKPVSIAGSSFLETFILIETFNRALLLYTQVCVQYNVALCSETPLLYPSSEHYKPPKVEWQNPKDKTAQSATRRPPANMRSEHSVGVPGTRPTNGRQAFVCGLGLGALILLLQKKSPSMLPTT
jgi:hypothetical protein